MSPEFQRMVAESDLASLEREYYDSRCKHFFPVDWEEDDDAIVMMCADALGLDSLTSEWRDNGMYVRYEGREFRVPLQMNSGDRHVTLCALNDVLAPTFEIRYLTFSEGADTGGYAALPTVEWCQLERDNPAFVATTFVDPRKMENIYAEVPFEDYWPPEILAKAQRIAEEKKAEEQRLKEQRERCRRFYEQEAERRAVEQTAANTNAETAKQPKREWWKIWSW
jgi:hypothetical protein